MNNETSMRGLVKVDILDHKGRVVQEGRWQPNLILDAGLNKVADVFLCDLFKFAVKGSHYGSLGEAIPMKEVIATSNTFTLAATGVKAIGTLTRVAGTFSFTAGDVNGTHIGSLIRCADTSGAAKGSECIITGLAGPDPSSVVDVRQVGNVNPLVPYVTKHVILYKVQSTGMTNEVGRTGIYSETPGENGTTHSGTVLTHKRTFIFDQEAQSVENFTTLFGTWDGSTMRVTRTGGTRNFVTTDIGSYIQFVDGQYCAIKTIVSATVVTVDRAPTTSPLTAAQIIKIYGHNKYTHIGFSNSETGGDPLNILVRLENSSGASVPITPLGNNPELTGQQIKVTYQMQISFGPGTTTAQVAPFSDTANALGSGGNGGSYVLEGVGASIIDPSTGDTDISSQALEPCGTGSAALSNVSTALKPLTPTSTAPPDRSLGAVVVPLTPDEYTADAFSRTFTAIFGVGVGTATNWRCMGIFDESANNFIWTFLFSHNRQKPSTYQMILHFRKTWNRDLT